MAENSNILHFDHNENNFGSRISTGNELYVTADSDVLNVTDDLGNHSFQECGNSNNEHQGDPNSNVLPVDIDLSLTDFFAKMKLTNESNVIMGSERESASSYPESTDMPSDNKSQEITLHVSQDFPLPETCSHNALKEALPSSEENDVLIQESRSRDISEEALTSSDDIVSPKLNSVPLTPEGTLPCQEVCSTSVSVDSIKEVAIPPSEIKEVAIPPSEIKEVAIPPTETSVQDVSENDLLGKTLPLPDSVRKSIENRSLSEVLSSPGTNIVTCQNTESECEGESVSLNDGEKDKSLDASGSTLLGQVPSFEEFSISSPSSTNKSSSNPDNESALQNNSFSVLDNQDLLKPDELSSTSAKDMESVVDLASANDELKATSSVNPDDNLFKVPDLPEENFISQPMQCSDPLEQDPFGLSMPLKVANEASNSPSSTNATRVDPCSDSSKCPDHLDVEFFGNMPEKPELKEGFLGIPDSLVFTDLRSMANPGDAVDDPFKVPDVPKEEEEEFADAVQFFKDPSSFKFLENIVTSGPPESVIPRSSLYLAFDPLHSKIVHGSQMQGVHLRRSEMGVPTGEDPGKNDNMPVNKNLVDLSARESMGNILISFDSPIAGNRAQSGKDEESAVPSEPPKCYTEEELQQALKIHELTLQEVYLKQHRDLEQELAKTKADSRTTNDKMAFLCKNLRGALEELLGVTHNLAEEKKQLQEKLDDNEKEIEKLKEDLERGDKDLQSVENTFSDFHKRYEQCKGMLKSYKDNEVRLKEEFTNLTAKLSERDQEYIALQERTQELLDKANAEVLSAKKSSDGQVTVLRAQLKKAELKISGLESDIKKVKLENSQLGGICDDLMDKVSKS